MIKNERAYRISKAAAARFEQSLADHEAGVAKHGAIGHAAEVSALRAQLHDLREQISEYENLRRGSLGSLVVSRLEDLPAMLIRARIARRLTHAQLAEQLDVKSQQIQRWEEDDYQSATFWRLIDVAEALGLAFSITAQMPEGSGDTGAQWPEPKRRVG